MAWSRLALYNVAASALGETPITDLSENRELRRKLDEIYTRGKGVISWAMEQGHWNYAMRAVKLASDPDVDPAFGFEYGFSKPTDCRKLNMIASDENFSSPLTDYEDEAGYWFSNIDPIYVRFVSDRDDYGKDFGKMPESFAIWLGHHMADQAAPGIKNSKDIAEMRKATMELRTIARSNDAMEEPARFPPISSWASARYGGKRGRRDRGLRSRLIG